MKRFIIILSAVCLMISLLAAPAPALEKWNVGEEIARLLREAPSLAAFPGAPGLVWMNSRRYSLTQDGDKLHNGIFLLLLGDGTIDDGIASRKFPYPKEDGAIFQINEASFYDSYTGQRLGDLPRREYEENGVRGIEILFPHEADEQIVAITTTETIPLDFRLDDVIFLADDLPVWEQTIEVEASDATRIYWEGSGLREPARSMIGRTQIMTWTLLNVPAWVSSGLVDVMKPSLVFSLDQGHLPTLRNLRELENPIYARGTPSSVASARTNLARTMENIARYMSPRLIPLEEGTDIVRPLETIPADGPWTAWEQVLIAGRWLSSLGFNANIYWEQKLPVRSDGPASSRIWKEPVVRAADEEGNEVYFKAGQSGDPEKLHPSLYGATLYRAGINGVERITLPRGQASDHVLSQRWSFDVDENGFASGTLDVTMTGGWMDVFAVTRDDDAETIGAGIIKGMFFNVLGANITVISVRPLPNGCRVSFSVEAVPGIVSSGSMLLRLMGGLPASFADIPQNGMKYDMRFPFIFEINSSINTPAGYRALAVPEKIEAGDSRAMLEQSLVHWPRRALAEGSCRWTVRSFSADEYLSGRLSEQLRMVVGWPETAIPLRK